MFLSRGGGGGGGEGIPRCPLEGTCWDLSGWFAVGRFSSTPARYLVAEDKCVWSGTLIDPRASPASAGMRVETLSPGQIETVGCEAWLVNGVVLSSLFPRQVAETLSQKKTKTTTKTNRNQKSSKNKNKPRTAPRKTNTKKKKTKPKRLRAQDHHLRVRLDTPLEGLRLAIGLHPRLRNPRTGGV